MLKEKLRYSETARRFEVCNYHRIQSWERIYLTEGPEGFSVKRRDRSSKGKTKQLPKHKHALFLLLEIAQLCRATFYYHVLKNAFDKGITSTAQKVEAYNRYAARNGLEGSQDWYDVNMSWMQDPFIVPEMQVDRTITLKATQDSGWSWSDHQSQNAL